MFDVLNFINKLCSEALGVTTEFKEWVAKVDGGGGGGGIMKNIAAILFSLCDSASVTCANVLAGDVLTVTTPGFTPVVLTAVAHGATPAAGQFAIGSGGTANRDTTQAIVAALTPYLVNDGTVYQGIGYSTSGSVLSFVSSVATTITVSAGAEARLVVVNHSTSDRTGTLADRLNALQAVTGTGYDTGTVTCAAVTAGKNLNVELYGGQAITLTSIAHGATPGSGEFAVGAGDTANRDTAIALKNAINLNPGVIASVGASPSAVVTVIAPYGLILSSDDASMVCVNHTESLSLTQTVAQGADWISDIFHTIGTDGAGGTGILGRLYALEHAH